MTKICKCRQTLVTYRGNRYETHLVSGATGKYFKDKTLLLYEDDMDKVAIFSCENPGCNTVFEMTNHIGETS